MKNIFLLLIVLLPLTAAAQTKSGQKSPLLAESPASSAGMSEERLSRIDAMLEEAVGEGQIPGAVALVARGGKIVYYKAFGMADNSQKRPLKRDDIFRIASQTKAITSTAVMMLWEEGRFQLDDPISKYLPEFKNAQVLDTFQERDTSYTTKPANKEITIRHLLTHTSGLGYGMIDADKRIKMIYHKADITDAFTTRPVRLRDNVKKLAALPLHHHPGEKFTYSESIDVLGALVEERSGMPLDEFLKKRLFEPLGMYDTWFYLPRNKEARLVRVQQKEQAQWVPLVASNYFDPDYPVKGAKTFFSGGAGLSSTAKDYASFLQMYLNGGELNGLRFLSRTTIQMMMANQIGNLWGADGPAYHGLAFQVETQKGQDKGGSGSAGTFSWGGYFNTQYFADPKEKIVAVLLKQTSGPVADETGWKFKILVEQAVDD